MNLAPKTIHAMVPRFVAFVVLGSLTLASTGLSSARSFSASDLAQVAGGTRTSDGGQVTISASWSGDSADLAFSIVMDTHAVDLNTYDLAQLAVLRRDDGAEIGANSWDAPLGGHHREGTLWFPSHSDDGIPSITSDSRSIELVIRDVDGVPERVLRWEVDESEYSSEDSANGWLD